MKSVFLTRAWRRCCVVGLLGLVCGPARAAAPTVEVVGGSEIVWAIRDMSDAKASKRLWRFAYRHRGPTDRTFWGIAVRGAEVVGEPRVAAVRGTRLHVWYADGTHRSYGPRRSGVERTLPDSAVPLAVAASDPASPIYAIVERSIALQLRPVAADSTEEIEAPEADEDQTGKPGAEETVRWPDSDYVVVRLDGGRWEGDRGLPRAWFAPGSDVHLLAAGSSLAIVYAVGETHEGYVIARSERVSAGWSASSPIEGLHADDLLAADSCDGAAVLVVARGDGSGVRTLRLSDDGWVEGSTLTLDGAALTETDRAAFGVLGADIVGVWVSQDDTAHWACWGVQGGDATDGEAPLRPLTPGPSVHSWSGKRVMLAYVTLMLVLAAVFFRRRVSVIDSVALPPHLRLASHGRRLLAFTIDAMLFVPAAAYVFRPLLSRFDFNEAMLRHAALVDGAVMRELTWRWVLLAAAFIVYATVFECRWRATPGKRVLHLRVVDESGGPCGFMGIVVRNVLRGVEFFPFLDLLPTLVLILLTKNHQRLGDLIGRTVVVEIVGNPSVSEQEPADVGDSK